MSTQENGMADESAWLELKLPDLLLSDKVRALHASIEDEWDSLQRSACQTAAGRALWKHITHDPAAELLAGEKYRLSCLKESNIFEVDFAGLLQMKATLLQVAAGSTNEHQQLTLKAKSITRVAADIRDEDWFEKLQKSGYVPGRNTIWLLEGIIYYLSHLHAMKVLKTIAANCSLAQTVLLADFMNKNSTTLSQSTFHFYSDWPDHLLPPLGFTDVRISQIGDPDAHFGLMHDPLNLFNKLRNLPRSVQTHPDDGTPCRRLYLVKASGSPDKTVP